MLIVEGTDLVGKTTLCKTLVERLNAQGHGHIYAHFSRLPKNHDFLYGYLERASPRIVQDRFHMSEPVYAYVRNEQTPLKPERYRLIDGYLRQLSAYTVVITCTADELFHYRYERHAEREMYRVDQVIKANDGFQQMISEQTDYRPDWDHLITVNVENPYPTESDIQTILREYNERLASVFADRDRGNDRFWAA